MLMNYIATYLFVLMMHVPVISAVVIVVDGNSHSNNSSNYSLGARSDLYPHVRSKMVVIILELLAITARRVA